MGREAYIVGMIVCWGLIFAGLFGSFGSGLFGNSDFGWAPWLTVVGGLGMVGLGLLRGRSGGGEK